MPLPIFHRVLSISAYASWQVYSPHTAVDAAPGGLGDWLADIVTGTLSEPEPETKTADLENEVPEVKSEEPSKDDRRQRPGRMALQRTYSRPTYPSPEKLEQTELAPYAITITDVGLLNAESCCRSTADHTREVIHPITNVEGEDPQGFQWIIMVEN